MNSNSAPGPDGVTVNHLKQSFNSKLPEMLSHLFNLCLKFGIVPSKSSNFCDGVIVPILKKPNIDPSLPNNYRPITVSNIFSKIFELGFLDSSANVEFDFRFVNGRGTAMAAATVNDVINYSVNQGSPVYSCSLDAEGAFDAIPYDIIFEKLGDNVSNEWWRCLYSWYNNLSVRVKLNNKLGRTFVIRKGTMQGSLSSPFMFNLFYKEMVSNLSAMECGIVIANSTFNAFCYADDLLLVSLTKTGLQKLINYANDYITSHGLRFNPNKTTCRPTIFGKNTLTPEPSWSLNNCNLKVTDYVTYLGVVLSSNMKSSAHVQDRIRKCQRAFYSVQSIGMCKNGSSCNVKSHIWKSIMLPILIYGCQCVNKY